VQQPFIDIVAPVGHGHLLLQPSSRPARLPSLGQVGVQTQVPCTQRPLVPQFLPPQLQVSMQVPLLQTLPALQLTLAHRLVTHLPPLQTWPLAHCTLAHGFAAAQVSAQTWPVPQLPLQALSVVHFPVPWSQYCPEAQVTPAQGWRKQPAMQAPPTQVSLFWQETPAQGSFTVTHVALQLAPPPQAIFALAHGSVWQLPARQTCPAAQGAGQPVAPPPPEVPAFPVPAPVPVPAPAPDPAPPLVTPPEVPAVPDATPRPAPPLGVPFEPAPPAGPIPVVPDAPVPPPLLPAGVEEPQPIAATNSANPMAMAVRSAALCTDR
jgi:hypothetical protein